MSQEKTILKCRGISRFSNAADRPEGTAFDAINVVCDKPDCYAPRRGFRYLSGTLPANVTIKDIIPYASKLLIYASDGKLYLYDNNAFTEFSAFTDNSSYMLSAESNGNLYLTASSGVIKLEASDASISEAGMTQGLSGNTSMTGGGSGFLGINYLCVYRVVFGIKDANGNLIIGAPTNRITAYNNSGVASNVNLTFDLPDEITTNHFYQVFRSKQSLTEPLDELVLCFESQPTDTDISNKYVTYVDSVPDSFLDGALALYTNSNVESISRANYEPPKSKDLCLYQGCMFYFNLTYKHSYSFQLMATGGTNGSQLNDAITIAGQTYTAKATETTASREFKLFSSSSPTTDVRYTAESLVRCINRNTANTSVYAYYDSQYGELPGKVRIEERDYGGAAFTVQCAARGASFNPNIATAKSSVAESTPNEIAFSKYQEPEAVPLVYRLSVGSKDTQILRGIPLRESLFVLTNKGFYRITGNDPTSFQVEAFDLTVSLTAPLSAVTLNNTIFCLTDQGIVRVSDTGVALISLDIEDDVKGWISASALNLAAYARGCKYETDRKYLLAVPEYSSDSYATKIWVYSTITSSWTVWDRDVAALMVNPANDRLHLAAGNSSQISIERKAFNFKDYSDEQISLIVSSVSGTTLSVNDTSQLKVGDMYFESDTAFALITAVNGSDNTITLDTDLTWNTGTFEARPSYNCLIEWNPISDGGAAHLKQWSEASLITGKDFKEASLSFRTDFVQNWETQPIYGSSEEGLWGLFPWGEVPWGGQTNHIKAHRTYVPRNKQRGNALNVKVEIDTVFTAWEIIGIEITGRSSSAKNGR